MTRRRTSSSLRRRRLNLLRQDPTCWYCGLALAYHYRLGSQQGPLPANFATVEHLFDRFKKAVVGATVLACPACNADVGRWSQALHRAGLDRVAGTRDMSTERDPQTDQPLPQPGRDAVHQLVIANLEAWGLHGAELAAARDGLSSRLALGISKYGRPLESHNGRDALQDCWEETLDATVYAVQMELEDELVGDVILIFVQLLGRLARMRLDRAV